MRVRRGDAPRAALRFFPGRASAGAPGERYIWCASARATQHDVRGAENQGRFTVVFADRATNKRIFL